MAVFLRIIREDWASRVFEGGIYYTSLKRRWERGLKCFFLMKTEAGDSVVGYGILEDYKTKEEWLKAGGENFTEHTWKTALIFGKIVKFQNPIPVKELQLDQRLKGKYLHGLKADQFLVDKILNLSEGFSH
ncbi:MAG: hypothetical protein QXM89_02850 [Candidatus Bathyarchaeia archaeon]